MVSKILYFLPLLGEMIQFDEQSPVGVCLRRSHCNLSGLTWFDIVFLSQALAEALKVNTTVKNIHLSWNRIGNEGAVAWLHLVALEKKNDISWIRLILVWNMSFFTSCRLHPFFLALGRLAPIPCQRFLEDLAQLLNHLSNAINVLQVSNINSTYSTHRIHVRYINLHLL